MLVWDVVLSWFGTRLAYANYTKQTMQIIRSKQCKLQLNSVGYPVKTIASSKSRELPVGPPKLPGTGYTRLSI